MYFVCFDFRSDLGFLNCDDVCMCVVNKQFEPLEFVSESIYVDLQYDEISLTFTAGSVCLCGVCSPWSVSQVVVVCPFQPSSSLIQVLWVQKVQFSYRLDGSVP